MAPQSLESQYREPIFTAALPGGGLSLFDSWMEVVFGLLVFTVLTLIERSNFLLFHTLSELFSIVTAFSLFVLAYSARVRIKSGYLIILGAAFFHVGVLDMLHTLSFKGTGVFPHEDANLPTQLWIAARYMQAVALVLAGMLGRRRVRLGVAFLGFGLANAALLALITTGAFPTCYVPGQGLTGFKIGSEVVICLMFVAAFWSLDRVRSQLGPKAVRLISVGLVLSVVSECLFLFYVDVYDLSLVLGHYAKVVAFYCIFKAVVENGYARPQEIMFREMNEVRKELQTAQGIARLGSWQKEAGNGAARWSDELHRLLGYEPGTVQTSESLLLQHVHADDASSLRSNLARLREQGEEFTQDVRFIRADSEPRHARIKASAPEAGRIVGSFQDITEQKQAEQLRADVESITRHDLRSPLAGIVSFAELLSDEPGLNDDLREMSGYIVESGYKMLALLNSSLDLYRMEHGAFELAARPVPMIALLERVLRDVSVRAEQGKKTLRLDNALHGGDDTIPGDELLCHTLFANLIQNALDASPKGGEVSLSVGGTNGGIRVTVRNQGVIPEDVRTRFFEKYATSGKAKGTGLGTYSARLITEVHGGQIGFSSSEAEGTSVWVELPRTVAGKGAEETPGSGADKPQAPDRESAESGGN